MQFSSALGAQCTDHWTTRQSRGVGVLALQLTKHVKSSTLYGRTVVRSYGGRVVRSYGPTVVHPIFSAWCVTTILYNYGATQAPLLLFTIFHASKHNTSFRLIKPPRSCTLILEKNYHKILDSVMIVSDKKKGKTAEKMELMITHREFMG